MTSEVCLLNNRAAVIAADSATTVTQFNNGRVVERYFKGANKIFQLSNYHPVGIMLYQSASTLGMPWEIIIKEFRESLGDKSFNNLSGYADEFFSYLNQDSLVLTKKFKSSFFLNVATTQAYIIIVDASDPEELLKSDNNPEAALEGAIVRFNSGVNEKKLPDFVDASELEKVIQDFLETLGEKLKV